MTVEWLLIPLGFVVGVYGTLIGAGGGFVLVPALLFLYPTASPATITSISLAVVFANAVSGSIAYARERRIDFRTGLVFAAATVPGAIIGALTVSQIPRGVFDGLFGLLLIAISLVIILRPPPPKPEGNPSRPGMVERVLIDGSGVRYAYRFYRWQGVLISFGVGFLSSLLGIGGGPIHVPALVLLLNFPPPIATATSQFILGIMAFAGTSVHLVTRELAVGSGLIRSLLLAVGVIPGAQLGAVLSRRVSDALLIRLLAAALAAVGLHLVLGLFVGS